MKPGRKTIVAIALAASILLYFAGVLSGLYANKITEERTRSNLDELESKTQRDLLALEEGTASQLTYLNSYISFLEQNLNTLQLEQIFLLTLEEEESCRFAEVSTRHLVEQLQFYRERLPFRLEQYERDNELSDEYLRLKRQYNTLSVRAWILLRNQYQACEDLPVTGLYFYTPACEVCVSQGEELDEFTARLEADGKTVMLFTVDHTTDERTISFIKEYYNITQVPAIILGDDLLQGRLFAADELLEALR